MLRIVAHLAGNITLVVGGLSAFTAALFLFSPKGRPASLYVGYLLLLVFLIYATRFSIQQGLAFAPYLALLAFPLAPLHGPLVEAYLRKSFFEKPNTPPAYTPAATAALRESASRTVEEIEAHRRIADAVREVFKDDRLHLNEELSLMDLARELGESRHTMSAVISAEFDTNFYGLVNRYRVNEARELLRDPDLADETILNIAYRSGFRSKAVFNRVFKEFTGQTPGEFRGS